MSRILAIDHGTVRIGLAISDEMQLVASPYKTLDAKRGVEAMIVQVVKEKRIGSIVIGMPLHMSGDKGAAAERVEKFAHGLRQVLPPEMQIDFVDERLSSVEAEASMTRAGITGKRERNEIVDQLAAVVILQDYLNSQRGPAGFLLPDNAYNLEWSDDPKRRRK